MVAVGVGHSEVARWVVGLVGKLAHDLCVERAGLGHHRERIGRHDVQRVRTRPTGSWTLTGARQHDSAALGPVKLTMVDRAVALARDHEVVGKPKSKKPSAERRGVIADDARPYALLSNTARVYSHGFNRTEQHFAAPTAADECVYDLANTKVKTTTSRPRAMEK